MGRPATLIIGFGRCAVMGCRRVPLPPAMITAQLDRFHVPKHLVQQMKPHELSGGIQNWDLIQHPGFHEVEDFRA